MKLQYFVLDVFTRDRLSGNPLAVVLKADALSGARMQAIAGEFNLSETVFVLAPENERHTARLRIFTPHTELPFAGHPTIGSAVLLGLMHKFSAVRLELKSGLVTAIMEKIDKRTGSAKFALSRLPKKVGEVAPEADIATHFGLGADAIGCNGMAPAQYSAGLPFYLVPIRDAYALNDIKLQRRGWHQTFPGDHNATYVFTATPDERNNDYAARMFGGDLGISEDAATGSAAAALIGMLAESGQYGDGHHELTIRQGREMGRPSRIEIQFNIVDGQLRHAGIGGSAVITAEGLIDLDE